MVIKYKNKNCLFFLDGEFLTLDEIGDGNYVKPKAPSPTGSTHKESSIWMCSQFLYCTSQHMSNKISKKRPLKVFFNCPTEQPYLTMHSCRSPLVTT